MATAPNVLAPVPQYQGMANPFAVVSEAIREDDRKAALSEERTGARQDRAERNRQLAIAKAEERSITQLAQASVVAVNMEYDKAATKRDIAGMYAMSMDGMHTTMNAFGASGGASMDELGAAVLKRNIVHKDPFLSNAVQGFQSQLLTPLTVENVGKVIPGGVADPTTGDLPRESMTIRMQDLPNHMADPRIREWLEQSSSKENLVRFAAQNPDKVFYDQETGRLHGPEGVRAEEARLQGIAAKVKGGTPLDVALAQSNTERNLVTQQWENRQENYETAGKTLGVGAAKVFLSDDYRTTIAASRAYDAVITSSPYQEGENTDVTQQRALDFMNLTDAGADVLAYLPPEQGADGDKRTLSQRLAVAQQSAQAMNVAKAVVPEMVSQLEGQIRNDSELGVTLAAAADAAVQPGHIGKIAFQTEVKDFGPERMARLLRNKTISGGTIANLMKARNEIRTFSSGVYNDDLESLVGMTPSEEIARTLQIAAASKARAGVPAENLGTYDKVVLGAGVSPETATTFAQHMTLAKTYSDTLDEDGVLDTIGESRWDIRTVATADGFLKRYTEEAGADRTITPTRVWGKMTAELTRETNVSNIGRVVRDSTVLSRLLNNIELNAFGTERVGGDEFGGLVAPAAGEGGEAPLVGPDGRPMFTEGTVKRYTELTEPERVAQRAVVSELSGLALRYKDSPMDVIRGFGDDLSPNMRDALQGQYNLILGAHQAERDLYELEEGLENYGADHVGPLTISVNGAPKRFDNLAHARSNAEASRKNLLIASFSDGIQFADPNLRSEGEDAAQITSVSQFQTAMGSQDAMSQGFSPSHPEYGKVAHLSTNLRTLGLVKTMLENGMSVDEIKATDPEFSRVFASIGETYNVLRSPRTLAAMEAKGHVIEPGDEHRLTVVHETLEGQIKYAPVSRFFKTEQRHALRVVEEWIGDSQTELKNLTGKTSVQRAQMTSEGTRSELAHGYTNRTTSDSQDTVLRALGIVFQNPVTKADSQ